jgi:hypothetical protein
MAIAPRNQSRRQGSITLLMPPPPAAASPLATCLAQLQGEWRAAGNLAALWQAWPHIAGPQLAHCRPLSLRSGRLAVGASHPQWLQALRYNRHQLLGALRGAGFTVRDLTIQLHYPEARQTPGSLSETAIWAAHPAGWMSMAWAPVPTALAPPPTAKCCAGATAASASATGQIQHPTRNDPANSPILKRNPGW